MTANRRVGVAGDAAPGGCICRSPAGRPGSGGDGFRGYLGIDVGSVSTNLVALSDGDEVLADVYLRTGGDPLGAVQAGLRELRSALPQGFTVLGCATTGSARQLTGVFVGADVVKNEITCHAVAAQRLVPEVQTVLEIGGQDSKIIILREGVVVDFAMNTVCAAGTGSFLDRQASRLGLPIERFGELALSSRHPVRIAGRCAVFAESDMIHKQQVGHRVEDIVWGLCQALVRNYLNNVAKGKEILPPVVFQGGVASNRGMKRAFEEALGMEVLVPAYHRVMGAIGAAILVREERARRGLAEGVGARGATGEAGRRGEGWGAVAGEGGACGWAAAGAEGVGPCDASPGVAAAASVAPRDAGGEAAAATGSGREVARSRFRGFELADLDYSTGSFDCDGCPNRCEVVEVFLDGRLAARWGGRCDRWDLAEAEGARGKAARLRAGRAVEDSRGQALGPAWR
ncbi:MAG: acyl-CoA dehydratase activase [Acetobacteraceae bacterium]|nr:acyl-CoA dehydratase activase [Acetobacteraceae bacterium]